MIKLSRLSTVKNLTRLALGGTLGATLIITASKPSEAAILGWDIRRDDPYGFDGSFGSSVFVMQWTGVIRDGNLI
jgi:hypothetical protein